MTVGVPVRVRLWVFFGLIALGALWSLSHAPKAHAQTFVDQVVEGDAFADGGDGGSARGGDGGRGGDGVLPACNGNANSVDPGDEDAVACGAGGGGGTGGNAGESTGGAGGIAFTVGRRQQQPEPTADEPSEPTADLAVVLTSSTATSTGCLGFGCLQSRTYTITNIGGATATAVSFIEDSAIAPGLTIVNSPPAGCTSPGAPGASITVTCANLGDLAPGASLVVSIPSSSEIFAAAGTLTFTGRASTPAPEATLANNSASGSTALHP